MNIAVIGSGATAFGVLLKLKELTNNLNLNVTIFSKDLNYINEIFLKNSNKETKNFELKKNKGLHSKIRHNFGTSFNEINIKNSKNLIYDIPYSGGLSDIWSASASLPTNIDVNNWGIKDSEINKYYDVISKNLNLSGKKSINTNKKYFETQPSKFVNSPEIKEHSLINKFIKKFNKKSINQNIQISKNYIFVDTNDNSNTSCINCQSCFSGCPRDSFFRPSKIINEWISKKIFSYKNEFVDKIVSQNDKYEIQTKNKKKFAFDKIFLCAGPYNSAKIIIKSFGFPSKKICLYDIPTKYFPIISLLPKIKTEKNTFGFSSASGSIVLDNNKYHHLLFGQIPKEYFYSKFGSVLLSKTIKRFFDSFCIYGTIYANRNDFWTYEITPDLNLSLNDNVSNRINENLNIALNSLKKELFKCGFLLLNKLTIDGKSSSHYSSNLFNAFDINLSNSGEFKKNLHICDSSVLGSSSSSQPHTFFLMANSYRLANNVFM